MTQGDARSLLLPDASVDLICTSPPYWSLRSYTDGGAHYLGQIGDEPTASDYLDNLLACTSEWLRVLKPSGSLFVNLGDKYGPDKSLLDLPARYAIRVRDELGAIKRAEIIWSKANGLPESVTDRVRRSHEVVFHFVKQPRYFSAVDEVREPHSAASGGRQRHAGTDRYAELQATSARAYEAAGTSGKQTTLQSAPPNPLGKLPGSVWTIPTSPLRVPESLGIDHFAAYPAELVRRIVLGWSPREVCTACGEGRRPVVHTPKAAGNVKPKTHSGAVEARGGVGATSQLNMSGSALMKWRAENPAQLTGYACACPDTTAPSTAGVVLDPFGGTGTTALVASVFGRVGISVDLSADYCRLAQWRTTDPKQRAKVGALPTRPKPARAPRPPAAVVRLPTAPVQDVLFGEGEWTA